MKTMMMKPKRMCCCCCGNMQMRHSDKVNQYIINIYKERSEHEKIIIYNSTALRIAS